MPTPIDHAPLLLPTPATVQREDGVVELPAQLSVGGEPAAAALIAGILSALRPTAVTEKAPTIFVAISALGPAESYHLSIRADGIRLHAASLAGVRAGSYTLAQLMRQYGDRLPALLIDDAPQFPVRGVMLDISRDRVPTMAHLTTMIEQLASWKINHLQLYVEHTVAYAGHDDVWRDASPLTFDELRTLDAHAGAHGIELVANQNCFGHLSSWLSHPRYAPLAEITPGETWDFNGLVTRTGPFSLCPSDPGALALVRDLLSQLLPTIASPLVNIGCDETFDVGQGRSRAQVAERGRAAVYLEFVTQVCAMVREHGKIPMFWADIALEHPEALAQLPPDLIGLAWGYEPDAPFARWCDQLRRAGRAVWVCPGTSCWRSITGRTTERRANLLAAARDGLAHGASGYVVTAWGDLGHRQQWPVTLHALAEAAHRAWSGVAPYDPRASSLHAFNDDSLAVGLWLDALGDVDLPLRQIGGKISADGKPTALRNASALFTDLTKRWDETWVGDLAAWEAVAERLHPLLDTQGGALGIAHVSDFLAAELGHIASVTMAAIARAIARRSDDSAGVADLRDVWSSIIRDHRDLWLARSRPGGLEHSCSYYQTLVDELLG